MSSLCLAGVGFLVLTIGYSHQQAVGRASTNGRLPSTNGQQLQMIRSGTNAA